MPNMFERGFAKMGTLIGQFRRSMMESRNARRPRFLSTWAESKKWTGGDLGVMDAAQRRSMTNTWLFTAVGMITRELSASNLQVVEYVGEEQEPEQIPNQEFEQILRRPNPYMSRQYLWQYTGSWLLLDGNAYWFLAQTSEGDLAELWPLPANEVQPWPGDKDRFIDHYKFIVNGQEHKIPAEYICHFQLPNPFDVYRGMSMLTATMLAIDSDSSMAHWNGAFFGRDNVMPSAIINMGSGEPGLEIEPSDVQEIKDDLVNDYSASNRRTLITTVQDLKVEFLGWNAKDMDFLAGREFTKDEIFSAFGIPGGLLIGNATEANAQTADRVFKEKTIWPLLTLLAEQITAQVMARFYSRSYEAQFEDIRPTNRQLELEEVGVAKGALTIDEVREKYWELEKLPQGVGASLFTGADPGAADAGGMGGNGDGMGEEIDERMQGVEFGKKPPPEGGGGTLPSQATQGKELERPPYPQDEMGQGVGLKSEDSVKIEEVYNEEGKKSWVIYVGDKDTIAAERPLTGAMVALYPPRDSLNVEYTDSLGLPREIVPEGSKLIRPEDFHVTLVFLGDAEDVDVDTVSDVTKQVAGEFDTFIDLEFKDTEFFELDERGYKPLVYRLKKNRNLMTFQKRLESRLKAAGIDNKSDYEFNPHITIAEVPEEAEMPFVEIPDFTLSLANVAIAHGEDRQEIPLAVGAPEEETKSVPDLVLIEAAVAEMKRWRTKSTKAVIRGESANVLFGSSILPSEMIAQVRLELGDCQTLEETKTVFNSVIRQLNGTEQEHDQKPISEAKHLPGEHDQESHGDWAEGKEKVSDVVGNQSSIARTFAEIAERESNMGVALDALPLGTRMKVDQRGMGKLNGDFEKVDLVGDPFWVENPGTKKEKWLTSSDFRAVFMSPDGVSRALRGDNKYVSFEISSGKKHLPGEHEQADHGNWADGSGRAESGLAESIDGIELASPLGFSGKDLQKMFAWEGAEVEIKAYPYKRHPMNREMEILEGAVDLNVDWKDDQGNYLGEADVRVTKGGEISYFMFLDVREQDAEKGTEIFNQIVDGVREAGYKKMLLYADATIGRYAWAKEGFDYGEGKTAADYASQVYYWMENRDVPFWAEWQYAEKPKNIGNLDKWIADRKQWSGELQRNWGEYWKGKSAYDVATWVHPEGFTLKGSDIENKDVPPDMELDIGKAYMLDMSKLAGGHGTWDAVIDLTG